MISIKNKIIFLLTLSTLSAIISRYWNTIIGYNHPLSGLLFAPSVWTLCVIRALLYSGKDRLSWLFWLTAIPCLCPLLKTGFIFILWKINGFAPWIIWNQATIGKLKCTKVYKMKCSPSILNPSHHFLSTSRSFFYESSKISLFS